MNEIWKPIASYEGLYEVSSHGRVKSLERFQNNKGKPQLVKGKILKQSVSNCGYKRVELCKNGCRKAFSVHRLVACAFVHNSENKPHVNHIDENKTNNHFTNLEWCTATENNNHGTHNERISLTKGTRVQAFDKNGNLVMEFHSISEAQRKTGINQSCISCCISGNYKQAGGYIWKAIVKEAGGLND